MVSLRLICCVIFTLSLSVKTQQQGTNSLTIVPDRGHMLGGTLITVSGPVFTPNEIRLRFDDNVIQCPCTNASLAQCLTPMLLTVGFVNVSYFDEKSQKLLSTPFYIENPMTSEENVWFGADVFDKDNFDSLSLYWNKSLFRDVYEWSYNMVIKLYGYREFANTTDFRLIQIISTSVRNEGKYLINSFSSIAQDFTVGAFQVSYRYNSKTYPILWSRPVVLGWLLKRKWSQVYNDDNSVTWAMGYCSDWSLQDKLLGNFTAGLTACPCTLAEAKQQPDKYVADFQCDQWYNSNCYGSKKVTSCVITRNPTATGAAQQCCYDSEGNIVTSDKDHKIGFPSRAHPFGIKPYNLPRKVPALSHLTNDVAPYFICCKWQGMDDNTCFMYRQRRPPSNCLRYPYPI